MIGLEENVGDWFEENDSERKFSILSKYVVCGLCSECLQTKVAEMHHTA